MLSSLRAGSATLALPVTAAAAVAFLADPRNAAEWFAAVTYAPTEASASNNGDTANPLREGSAWLFISTGRGGPIPMRMLRYTPPNGFTWETTYSGWRDNLRWEITCEERREAQDDGKGERATSVTLTIRLAPGPLGWLALLASAPLMRFRAGGLIRRATRALERARETLIAYNEVAAERTAQRKQRRAQSSARKGTPKARRFAGGLRRA